jgi:cobalt/nickel transport protein
VKRLGWFLAGGLLVAILLAGVVSSFASSSPDGLDATARQGCTTDAQGQITGGTCIAQKETTHELGRGLLTGAAGLPTGVAGVIGVVIVFGLSGGVFWLVRRRKPVA